MSNGQQSQGTPTGDPVLTPAEQAAVEKGRTGFSEPENVLTPAPTGAVRPDNVPEKFWDAERGQVNTEALIKSYTELERTRTPETPAVAPEVTPAPVAEGGKIAKPEAAPEVPAGEPAANPLTEVIAAAQQEYASAREVTEDTIVKLEEAGIPREIFALYLKGVEAQEQATTAAVHAVVGGEEAYNEMARWAASNLSDAELDAFNNALDNEALRENAVRGLYSRFNEARPNEGRMIAPNGDSNAGAGDTYQSRDQLISDQKDPRYQTDAAFRAQVQDKLLRSQANGFQLAPRPLFERQVLRT